MLPAALPSSLLSSCHVEYLSCKTMCLKQILFLPLSVACSVILDYSLKLKIINSCFFDYFFFNSQEWELSVQVNNDCML